MLPSTVVRAEETKDETPPPRTKHLTRMSERRFDGLVETLCGLIKQPLPPKGEAKRCKTCEEIYEGIRALDRM